MPTIPEKSKRRFRSRGDSLSGKGRFSTEGACLRFKSFWMRTAWHAIPFGSLIVSTAVTVPEILACTGALKRDVGLPIICPMDTAAPSRTAGEAGVPICCCMGMMTSLGVKCSKTRSCAKARPLEKSSPSIGSSPFLKDSFFIRSPKSIPYTTKSAG